VALKSYKDFEKVISPLLKSLKPQNRKSTLEKMYALAGDKLNREEIKQIAIDVAGSSRTDRKALQKKRMHIRNAVTELRAADQVSPMRIEMLKPDLEAPPTGPLLSPVAIPWLFDFQAAIDQLQMMDRELQKIEDSLVDSIHPKRRRGSEKTYPPPGDRQQSCSQR
jgi:hypothetical protein